MKERRSRDSQAVDYASLEEARLYEEHSLTELRANGYRITMPRVQVIRALADTRRALSAYAIHEKIINAGGKIDVVSVYRILSTLQEVGLIHHIGVVDGYFPCRTTDCRSRRSEVIVCERCQQVQELAMSEVVANSIEEQAKAGGFVLSQTKIELTATTCPRCKGK
jgi:Fur family transcriptional regulator, zinc uptake regulator